MAHPRYRRIIPRSGLLAAIVFNASAVEAESVIDLDAPFSGRVVGSVMDLDAPRLVKKPVEKEPAPQVVVSTSGPALVSMPRGTRQIEAMISDVASGYMGHQGLRRAGLSASEWMMFFRANIAIESAFNPRARSHVGAIGLGQLMPRTAAVLGVNPHDPRQNLHGSARYLLAQLARFGSPELALAAYNAGPEAVAKYSGVPPYRETQGHVRKVMAIFRKSLNGDNQ